MDHSLAHGDHRFRALPGLFGDVVHITVPTVVFRREIDRMALYTRDEIEAFAKMAESER